MPTKTLDAWATPEPRKDNAWTYCDRMYFNGEYPETSRGILNMSSSIVGGMYITEELSLRGNEPYIWREHYLALIANIKKAGLDEYSMDTSDTLKRHIEILASKNHYPPHSIMRILVWHDTTSLSNSVEYAILQQKRPQNVFEINTTPLHLGLKPSTVPPIHNFGFDKIGANAISYYWAKRESSQNGLDGMCMTNTHGNIARSSVGNIYVLNDKTVIGVSPEGGAVEDALTPTLLSVLAEASMSIEYADMGLDAKHIDQAQECFVCGATIGLRAVMSVGTGKRFFTTKTMKLADILKKRFLF